MEKKRKLEALSGKSALANNNAPVMNQMALQEKVAEIVQTKP